MESKNDRKRELLPEWIFNDFGPIWDPPKRPKIDQNGWGTLGHSVFVLVCVGFLDLDPILIDFDPIWTPLWTHFASNLTLKSKSLRRFKTIALEKSKSLWRSGHF